MRYLFLGCIRFFLATRECKTSLQLCGKIGVLSGNMHGSLRGPTLDDRAGMARERYDLLPAGQPCGSAFGAPPFFARFGITPK